MLEIDHVLFAVADAENAALRLEAETGLVAIPGGRHVGRGTGNWIVPLGDTYIELITVTSIKEAKENDMGRFVMDKIGRRATGPAAVCLRTDDIDSVSDRISTEPISMSRRTETGEVLRWRLAGLETAMSDRRLPFFIQWDIEERQHPGLTEVKHRVEVDGIAAVGYGGDHQDLNRWLGGEVSGIGFVPDQPHGPLWVTVATPRNEIRISSIDVA